MKELELLREDLSQCDEILMNTLVMRSRIVEQIMACKERLGLPILQPQREAVLRARVEERVRGLRYSKEILDIYESILLNSKRLQARRIFDFNVVLIGFMGTGKTTIAGYLSTLFAMEVVEMDQVIAEEAGMSISEIFETYGEEYFRDAETNLLIRLQTKKNTLISCGGGVPLRERNVAEMRKNGKVVLLTAGPDTVLNRLRGDHTRPLLEHHKDVNAIAALMEQRRKKYEAAADIVLITDGKTELEICEELVQRLLADREENRET